MEKLLQNLQKPPIYPTGVVPQPYAPPSDQKMIHAPPPFHVTAQPVPFYAPSNVQPSNPSGRLHPHAPPMSSGQQPSTVNLSNLYSKHPLYVYSLQQPLFSGNEIDQPQNRSDIEAGESSTHSKPTELSMYSKNPMFLEGRHQFGFLTRETVRPSPGDALERLWKGEDSLIRFMLINSMEPQIGKPLLYAATAKDLWDTTQTLYLKRQNASRLYTLRKQDHTNAMGVLTTPTIDSAAFSARSSNHDSDKNNGKSIPVCEHCKKQWHTKDQCWKLHGRPPGGKKRSSNEKQNSGRAYISETTPTSTSQSTDPTVSQTKTPTLGAIVQSGSSKHFISYAPCAGNEKIRIADVSLALIAGKGQIVPFDGFALQNVLHVPKLSYNLLSISKITRELHFKAIFLPGSVYFQDMSSGRTIGTARHSRGLYILDDDTSCSSLSRVSLLSSYFSTSEQDFAHLINRIPSRILHLQTPLDCLKESYPSTRLVSEVPLCVFGCTAYVHNFGPNQSKFTHRAQACVFVGYPLHQRGYKCFHPPSRKYFVTLDVTFCENRPYFPVSHLQEESVSEEPNSTFEFVEPTPITVFDIDPHPIILPTNQVPWKTYYRRNLKKEVGSPTSQPPAPVQDFEPPRDQGMENPTKPCTNNTMSENDKFDVAVLENMEEKNRDDEIEVRIETSNDEAEQGHTRKLDEYDPSLDIPIALRKGTRSCTKHPICNYVSYDNLSPQFRAFTANLDFTVIPKNIYTALECPEWKNAVMEEMKALEKNRTWEIYALPKGHKTIGCKWVFSLKYKADGTLDRHKARVLLFIAVNKDWPLYQLDVKNAFLNGDLVEEVYMSPRQDLKPNLVSRFTTFVKSQGYSQGHSNHTLFTKASKTGKIAILIVYVDDIVLTGDDQTEISQLKQRMGDEFEIKDLGNLKYFLGMEVARSKEGISVSQRKYTLDLLTETGKLIYLSHTRPDISFAVSVVSQFMQAPYEKHMEPVNRILRYLKNTPGKGLMFRKTNRKTIEAYTDSDWAGSVIDRKSTSGYCTFVWGNLVTWRSKKQSIVARSSAEAEYRAMSLGICEKIWLQKVLSDLHQECETPLKLFCDNKAAISIANNPVQHDRTKHVEIDRHFIKERLESGSICIPYIPSSQQIADVLTKGLLKPHFDLCVSKLGLIDIYVPT
ncbi:Cysteine-rich RLK (RECEPTOR-like protein kinase) 8 [Cucumis melo var. makuwa]|uniref:Cysteine-rich RLK (RECEPTOR-like protein kinase) 8 n=1 Tax=Cucumis melo var. makuwa TaxID=1194695 RepID=A0A5A7T3F0_CUCMM|nr:Cysteine-rich RLK (RECEPTOR-like protein kinase) 8 [Cucumis melo var. makuwa]